MSHRQHKYMSKASYCWTCSTATQVGVPGWEKTIKAGDGPRLNYEPIEVVWADGTRDWANAGERRACELCGGPSCHKPVHAEEYGEKVSKLARDWDDENPVI